jgi:hypothetical protein
MTGRRVFRRAAPSAEPSDERPIRREREVATERDQHPDQLDDIEGPGAGEEAVSTRQRATEIERESAIQPFDATNASSESRSSVCRFVSCSSRNSSNGESTNARHHPPDA